MRYGMGIWGNVERAINGAAKDFFTATEYPRLLRIH